ncbi:hypothetical protein [Hyphomicrobium sp.]|uniref:hypothetical protein n=1 Tax=Hyphomicrobium sp. TaxID=82 RepID=UPI000FAB6970|nr:hypothetical protein [Hyphomicrobium sp.]RUP00064.1 MAG: hypothetical protein EKK30_02815 [Hyphomicrobium sp.]
MKMTLRAVLAATLMVLGAGLANAATVSGDVHSLKLISEQSPAAQHVYWRHWRHRHCWWRHGYRHCRYW